MENNKGPSTERGCCLPARYDLKSMTAESEKLKMFFSLVHRRWLVDGVKGLAVIK